MAAHCSQIHELDSSPIAEAVRIRAERLGTDRRELVRLHLPLGTLDPWTLLTRASEDELFVAWQDGRTGDRFAGLGAAAEVCSNDITSARQGIGSADVRVHTIDERGQTLDDSSLPTWIGGFAFAPSDAGLAGGPWEGWPAGWLWIPRIMLWRGRSHTALLVTTELGPELSADLVVQRLLEDCSVVDALPRRSHARQRASNGLSERDMQPRSDWLGRAEQARTAIARGAADKIVIARTVTLHAPNARFDVLASLRQLHDHHGGPEHGKCTLYAIGGRDGSALVGATPETLVHLDGKNLITAAIAGTAPRKADPEDDRGEAAQLVASLKERREHQLVVRAMQEALGPLCRRLTIDTSPIVRKLSLMQHLETPIRGELHEALHVLDLVRALHPTPAVAGWPTQDAIGWLQKNEPVDRGWYAGPLGWTSANGGGHFVVALRCALVRGNTAWAYAGAGITDRSVPAAEWEETTLKLRTVGESLRTG